MDGTDRGVVMIMHTLCELWYMYGTDVSPLPA